MLETLKMPKVLREVFGKMPDGASVEIITLRGDKGFEARLITYGAVIQSLIAPDRNGRVTDVVLGRDDLAGYIADRRFLGATVGRFANRISAGKFELDGKPYQLTLSANDGGVQVNDGWRSGRSCGRERRLAQRQRLVDGAERTPCSAEQHRSSWRKGDPEHGVPGWTGADDRPRRSVRQ